MCTATETSPQTSLGACMMDLRKFPLRESQLLVTLCNPNRVHEDSGSLDPGAFTRFDPTDRFPP
jgi:hypothetical protein